MADGLGGLRCAMDWGKMRRRLAARWQRFAAAILICSSAIPTSMTAAEPHAQSPAEFSAWVDGLKLAGRSDSFPGCEMARKALLERLKSGLDVYDDTIKTVVTKYRSADYETSRHDREKTAAKVNLYDRSRAFMEELKPLVEKRAWLYAWLHEQEGMCYRSDGMEKEAIGQRAKALDLLDALRIQLSLEYVENAYELGDAWLRLDKAKADEAFLEAKFPFYLLPLQKADRHDATRLRELHASAIDGLLMTRQGDAKLLRQLECMLIEGMKPKYKPRVEALIREAEGAGGQGY
jgi:hypothetical protein